MPKFDIIVVTYNAKKDLSRCLASIVRFTDKKAYDLTIVDNNSSDGTAEFIKRKYKRAHLIKSNINGGFSYGANIGVKNTRNKFIALLDDDIQVCEDWLQGLYKQIKRSKQIGIVGPKIVYPDNRIFSAEMTVPILSAIGHDEIDRGQRDYVIECDALPGPCWLMRRDVFKNIGFFDERFFPCQYEDTDYCLRLRLKGYKIIYCGKIKIFHKNLYRTGERTKRNYRLFERKWKRRLSMFPLKDSCKAGEFVLRGSQFCKAHDFNNGLKQFRIARSIHKRFVNPFHMGFVLYHTGHYREALKEFSAVLRIHPKTDRLYKLSQYYLALSYKKAGCDNRALTSSIKFLNSDSRENSHR